MKEIADSDGNIFGEESIDSEPSDAVGIFGEPEPKSDFEKKCQALRGWRIGHIAADEITGEIGRIKDVDVRDGFLYISFYGYEGDLVWDRSYHPRDLINLSRGE